ncbi:alpha/beta fold hydrolase [Rhodobacter sp. NTK016B]|uniref:alpha/beta fold hydrolase n=1 Tax=Rhodobacter sp. NTK016B TaxID=2759676 RepID=UPI001A90C234|nr:alpha/beta hydrolase [Rhodobacter sp. NTK016B]MBN8290842.1 alpha/beta fold hydrolase [Rhodobacter sp. NTK016B]
MPELVCLPGLLCETEVFAPLLAALNIPARAIALPRSDSFDAIVDTLAPQIPDGATLLGMSMGSYLALALARRYPAKVGALILVGTNAAADSPEAATQRGKVARWAAREGIEALATIIADTMLSPARRDDATLRETIRRMAAAQGIGRFTDHQTALATRPDQSESLAALACPVLVITGSADTVTPPAAGRAVAEGVTKGRYVELDGVGHMAVLEAPEAVAALIEDFHANPARLKDTTQ